jgi:hypothetical protein
MKYLNKTVFSLAVAGMSVLSGNLSAQFLGGHRIKVMKMDQKDNS